MMDMVNEYDHYTNDDHHHFGHHDHSIHHHNVDHGGSLVIGAWVICFFLFSHSFFILYIFDCRSIFHGYWISFCVNICQKYFVSIGFVKIKILVILEWWSIDWSSLLSRSLVVYIVQLSEYTICPSGCLVTVMKLVILIELPSHHG